MKPQRRAYHPSSSRMETDSYRSTSELLCVGSFVNGSGSHDGIPSVKNFSNAGGFST